MLLKNKREDLENLLEFYEKSEKSILKLQESKTEAISFGAKLALLIKRVSKHVRELIKNNLSISTEISSFSINLDFFSKNLISISEDLKADSENLVSSVEETNACIEESSKALSENVDSLRTISGEARSVKESLNNNNILLDEIVVEKEQLEINALSMKEDINKLLKQIDGMKKVISGIEKYQNKLTY